MKLKRWFFIFLSLCVGFSAAIYGEEQRTDRYASVYAKDKPSASQLKDPFSLLLALPFEIMKWPLDKTLFYIEEYRLDKKAIWFYEKGVEYGITPRLDASNVSFIPCYGVEFDLLRLARLREKYPDLISKAWINHGPTSYFQVGSELGFQRIAGTGLHTAGFFQYSNSRDETFYGFGMRSSLGDSTSFIEETTSLGGSLGYEISPTLDLNSKVMYEHTNISPRAHGGKGDMNQIFAGQNIPGISGDDRLAFSMGINRDTRDSKEDATAGSYQKLLFKFTEGVNSSSARYLTYQADMAKYFSLASPRRILVTRLFGEFNQTVNEGTVPFYSMARLGGYGMFPRQGQTERGFVYNRFTGQSALLMNLEYRYTLWQYREFKMKTAFFLDEGQVSKDFGTFQWNEFRTSYGTSFYLGYSNHVLLNFSVARSSEGTYFYLDNKIPF